MVAAILNISATAVTVAYHKTNLTLSVCSPCSTHTAGTGLPWGYETKGEMPNMCAMESSPTPLECP
jgi:hypothetical protein